MNRTERMTARREERLFLKQKMLVKEHDYANSVELLLDIAFDDTSGSLAAAQVLLGCYNSKNYHLSISDLGLLDTDSLNNVLIIRGYTLLHIEPHNIIENGKNRFLQLQEQWESLNISQR